MKLTINTLRTLIREAIEETQVEDIPLEKDPFYLKKRGRPYPLHHKGPVLDIREFTDALTPNEFKKFWQSLDRLLTPREIKQGTVGPTKIKKVFKSDLGWSDVEMYQHGIMFDPHYKYTLDREGHEDRDKFHPWGGKRED